MFWYISCESILLIRYIVNHIVTKVSIHSIYLDTIQSPNVCIYVCVCVCVLSFISMIRVIRVLLSMIMLLNQKHYSGWQHPRFGFSSMKCGQLHPL